VDHPLRAVKAACETMGKAAALHAGFNRQGKEIPPCSCGLWTGEAVVGTMGDAATRHYTALGLPVDLAEKLCKLARPGEILLPEHTLNHILKVLPEGWTHLQATSESEPDLSDFQWTGDEIEPLPENLRRMVYLIGPGVDQESTQAEYYFDYLWCLKVPGQNAPVPILRVVRPSLIGDSIELSADNVVASEPSQTLGKYRLIDVLGTGGMGRVWRAVDRFGNHVAIKVLHSHESVTEAQLKRFRREAEIMARLPHRNICRVFEMNEFEGIQYIAMEYVDGLSLADLLHGAGQSTGRSQGPVDLPTLIRSLRADRAAKIADPEAAAEEEQNRANKKSTRILPVQQSLSIVLRVCEAIQFAHEHGVLHRDLKPGNILLRADGEPLVADFGLAKLNSSDATQSLSVSGHVVGTLENMPPEQAESSKDVDERADVYSLGTILFQLLTGRRHFEATGNIVTDAQALRTHEPPRLRSINPKIDVDLEIITLKALRNDPAARYQSVSALRADLERYLRGEVITAKPVSAIDLARKIVQRNRVATAVAAASLALIVGTVVVAVWSLSRQLANETAARKESESLRAEAEMHKIFAEEKRVEAEEKEKFANEQLQKIQDLLAQKEAAERAAAAAKKSSERALAETKSERELREKAERESAEKENLLEETKKQIEEMQAAAVAPPPEVIRDEPRRRDPATLGAIQQAMGEAMRMFHLELSPFELRRYERNPERVVELLSDAIDLVSGALGLQPDFTPAWMLKGRLHLAAMEFASAKQAFDQAAASAAEDPSKLGDDDADAMSAFADSLLSGGTIKAASSADSLLRSSSPQDHAAGHVLKFLSSKPSLLKSGLQKTGPLGRPPTRGELALALMIDNKLDSVPAVSGDLDSPGGITVSIDGNAENLSAIKGTPTGTLSVKDSAAIDWETLLSLPLESLNLSGSQVESLPGSRAFLNLRVLDLSKTRMSSLEPVRYMPRLETLNLAGSEVSDLSPLINCRRLQSLDISSTNPANLRILLNLPLESLTLSPLLLSDRASLIALRGHRTLKTLRTPTDPEQHAPAQFWQKLESNAYDTSQHE
jgi:serine/threonine protein kinase